MEGTLSADDPSRTRPLKLRSLGAEFNEQHHGVYLEALRHAIDHRPSMRNIALTGAYGTGKSSVLSEVSQLYSEIGRASCRERVF